MAITSNDVSQLIAQNAANIQTQQMASLQANYPATGVGPGLQIPEPSGFQAGIPGMAASAATYAGGVPGGLTTGIGLAAAFGYAPRFLDPFTQSLHAGKLASAARGGFMASMGGAAAGVGAAAATFGAYAAVGAAADYMIFDPFKTGAQMRGQALGAIHSFMPAAPMSSMATTAAMMENIQRQSGGMYGMGDLTNLMGMGVSGGDIRTMDMNSFQSDFKTLISKTKEVAQALSTSLTEAYGAMREIRSLGVSDVAGTAYGMRGLGVAAGISPAEMMGIARGGSALAKQAGISRDIGVSGAMSSAAMFGYIGQKKLLGEDFGLEDLGTFQNAGYRFFGSMQGQKVLAAMMNQRGEMDESIAQQIAQGTISKSEINRLSNITLNKRQDLFGAHSSELVATYLSQFGPQGIVNPLSPRQGLTGLNQEQMHELGLLNASNASLKQQISNAAAEGFTQGTQKLGLSDQLQLAVSKMTAPIREKFSQMAASLTQTVAESIEDLTKDFVTRPAGTGAVSNFGVMAVNNALATGNISRAGNIQGVINASGLSIGPRRFTSAGALRTGFLSGMAPRALTAEAFNEEIDLLPGLDTPFGTIHGLTSHSSNMRLAGGAGLGLAIGGRGISGAVGAFETGMGIVPEGLAIAAGRGGTMARLAMSNTRNIGYLTEGLSAAGRAVQGLGGAAEIGLTGVGTAAGTARLAGGALRLTGGLAKYALGPVGAALAVYDSAQLGMKAGHYLNAAGGSESRSDADFTQRGQMARRMYEAAIQNPNDPVNQQILAEVFYKKDSEIGRFTSSEEAGLVEIGGTTIAGSSASAAIMNTVAIPSNYLLSKLPLMNHERANAVSQAALLLPTAIPGAILDAVVTDNKRMYMNARGTPALDRAFAAMNPSKVITEFGRRRGDDLASELRHIAADPRKSLKETEMALITAMGREGRDKVDQEAVNALLKLGGKFDKVEVGAEEALTSRLDAAKADSATKRAASFAQEHLGLYNNIAADVLSEGKYGPTQMGEMAVEVEKRFLARFTGTDSGAAEQALSVLSDGGKDRMLALKAAYQPMARRAMIFEQERKERFSREKGDVQQFLSMASGAAGMTGVVSQAATSLFAAYEKEGGDPVQRNAAVTEFYEKMIDSKATAEQIGLFTSRMGMSKTELGIDIAARGAGYARLQGLEEQFFGKGKTGKGKQWAEAFLNTSLAGTGLEDFVKGKSNTATAEARLRVEQGLIDMLRMQTGGALSPEQVRTAQSNVQRVLDHMRGKGRADDVKELGKIFGQTPSATATPSANDAQQAKMMAAFNETMDNVTKKMQTLANAIPTPGGTPSTGTPAPASATPGVQPSDARLKDNIRTLSISKYTYLNLRGVSWSWNSIANTLGLYGEAEGVLAQEVAEIYPHATGTDERGWMFVRYDLLDAMLGA